MSEYWMAACPKCGWVGSSKDCEGGGQIADTGDYAEVVCPRCFKGGDGDWVEVEDAEEYLSASQAREAALREKLEAAEARIKASQEQDFACTVLSAENHTVWWNDKYTDISQAPQRNAKLYAAPVIPPELAELQRELTKSVRDACSLAVENAELRKLLESKVPEVRNEVWQLALAMERKLQINEHKGGWKTCDVGWLWDRLREESYELRRAVSEREDILGEAADVANFAMMIADVEGVLSAQPKEPKQSPETDLDEAQRRQ